MVCDSAMLYYRTPITHIAGTTEFGGNCVVNPTPRRSNPIAPGKAVVIFKAPGKCRFG